MTPISIIANEFVLPGERRGEIDQRITFADSVARYNFEGNNVNSVRYIFPPSSKIYRQI